MPHPRAAAERGPRQGYCVYTTRLFLGLFSEFHSAGHIFVGRGEAVPEALMQMDGAQRPELFHSSFPGPQPSLGLGARCPAMATTALANNGENLQWMRREGNVTRPIKAP